MHLRSVIETDLPAFYEHQREPAANRMAAFPPRDFDAFMAHWRSNLLDCARTIVRTIVVDHDAVGHVVSWERDGDRLVGYWVGAAYWGRGIATAALAEFLAHHEPTRPVYAYVARENLRSMRVLEKCGFSPVQTIVGADGIVEISMRLG